MKRQQPVPLLLGVLSVHAHNVGVKTDLCLREGRLKSQANRVISVVLVPPPRAALRGVRREARRDLDDEYITGLVHNAVRGERRKLRGAAGICAHHRTLLRRSQRTESLYTLDQCRCNLVMGLLTAILGCRTASLHVRVILHRCTTQWTLGGERPMGVSADEFAYREAVAFGLQKVTNVARREDRRVGSQDLPHQLLPLTLR
mmetsp:Transcript_38841/g.79552  ORF Transcript_38841/g.79552 Transcript_38841/m.79552 type:complete len:202 (+) Transcript_38841:234-839(+)